MDKAAKAAGFWVRFLADIIDTIILFIPYIVLHFYLFNLKDEIFNQLVDLIIYLFYTVGFLCSAWQATPGERLLGIYIVNAETRQKIKPLRAVVRCFILCGPFLLLTSPPMNIPPNLSDTEQKEYTILHERIYNFKTVTKQEKYRFYLLSLPGISEMSLEEYVKYLPIHDKILNHQQLNPEEFKFLKQIILETTIYRIGLFYIFTVFASLFYLIIQALTITLTKEKTALHDMICKTRALRGRPQII